MNYFVETSAILRMMLNQEGGVEIYKKISHAENIFASRLLKIEVERTLIRLSQAKLTSTLDLSALRSKFRDFWSQVNCIEISREVCDRAGVIADPSHLRTLDAIHLASFILVRESISEIHMLSFDERLLAEI